MNFTDVFRFRRAFDLCSSKDQSQGALTIKQPTMLCSLDLLLPMDSHNLWGRNLLGEGLRTPSAFH